MSYTELHFGKLKPISESFSLNDLKELLKDNPHLEVEDFEEKETDEYDYFEVTDKTKKYKEPLYIKYILKGNRLFEMIEHSGEKETDDLDLTTLNEDGTINFTYMFYNGGTCFSEMLEDGLEEVLK